MAEDPLLLGALRSLEASAAKLEAEMAAEATAGPETPRHRQLRNLLARLEAVIDQFRSGIRDLEELPRIDDL